MPVAESIVAAVRAYVAERSDEPGWGRIARLWSDQAIRAQIGGVLSESAAIREMTTVAEYYARCQRA